MHLKLFIAFVINTGEEEEEEKDEKYALRVIACPHCELNRNEIYQS